MKQLLRTLAEKYLLDQERQKENQPVEKYKKSGLTKEQALIIRKRIEVAFEDEHMYRQNDIGLIELSKYVDFDRYKVSEVINKYYAKNFYALLNYYRIKEAKELLVAQPFSSVKAIMYEVGFNSKNSFYNAFKKDTGLSPNDYRNMWVYGGDALGQLQFQ
ncbi:MAG: AraC family transcriptional regulator [Allomuricauda sp.]|nr:MAG: AraC family transcriptional regulator [Allomuricauda sp.]